MFVLAAMVCPCMSNVMVHTKSSMKASAGFDTHG